MAILGSLMAPVIEPVIQKILDFIPDPVQKAAALAQAQKEAQDRIAQAEHDQTVIDAQEATSANWFVAGWRPAVGWVCASGLAYQFLVSPLGTWLAALCGHPVVAPKLDVGDLMPLLTGMLGIAGLRTFEKINNVSDKH